MATTSFTESLQYGARLFGYLLAVLLVGGGFLGLGAVLAVPEIQAWRASGSPATAELAGGLVLAVLGVVTLVIGQVALLYKFVADAVARGSPAPMAAGREAGATADSEEAAQLGPSPGEQAASDHGPGQTVPAESEARTVPSGDPAATDAPAPEDRSAREPTPTDQPPSDRPAGTTGGDTPAPAGTEETGGQGDRAAEQSGDDGAESSAGDPPETREAGQEAAANTDPAPRSPEGGESEPAGGPEPRERTAEEIAFGSTPDSRAGGGPEDASTAGGDQAAGPGDDPESEWFDSDEREGPEPGGAATGDPLEGEDKSSDVDRSEIETAGNGRADPLSEEFDDE